MRTEEKKRMPDTHHLPKIETVDTIPRSGGRITTGALSSAGRYEVSDKQFVFQHGTPEEFSAMKKAIQVRLAKEPKFLSLRCTKCGFRTEVGFRASLTEGNTACLSCNKRADKRGGMLKPMTDGEIKAWEKDKIVQAEKRAAYEAKLKEAKKVAAQVEFAKGIPR
jgi:DNA-directed RNA polymerase subunit M/transcription elongation factor TFIIS